LNKWIFEQGWVRTFRGSAIQGFRKFDADTFPTLIEPPSYFKKEVRQSSEMNYHELRAYIADLQQSGFDGSASACAVAEEVRLSSHYPRHGDPRRSVLALFRTQGRAHGIAVALGVAIVYFVAAGLFEAMGNASQLPASMAAWAPDLIFGLLGGYLLLKVPT